jgi:hypothetical protein
MSGGEIALIITALGTFTTSLGSVVMTLRNGRKIDAVHSSTNGKMEELLKLTAKSAHAEGVLEQKGQRPDPPHSLPEELLPPVWPDKPK